MDIKAVTRGLDPQRLEEAYRSGLFPMYDGGSGWITWHRPARRAIMPLDGFHVSRSLRQTLRKGGFRVSVNEAFDAVMAECADRPGEGTWINDEFRRVYGAWNRQGKAHSVEVWVEGQLAGGVYGVHLGGAFFAESKFHRVRDMSKVALACLVDGLRENGFALLDVQYLTPHLARLGAVEVPHRRYAELLKEALQLHCRFSGFGKLQV
ncbi:MAG: leucyl/phenylalanyl-tRNA--protein transferase [Acidimicrobiia bacterium]|nr:leucyl/phenylalanyl-tRNA--protein transferase [Acidimicrobiia bacterium]